MVGMVRVRDLLIGGVMGGGRVEWEGKMWVGGSVGIKVGVVWYFKYRKFVWDLFGWVRGGRFRGMEMLVGVGIWLFRLEWVRYRMDV